MVDAGCGGEGMQRNAFLNRLPPASCILGILSDAVTESGVLSEKSRIVPKIDQTRTPRAADREDTIQNGGELDSRQDAALD
jgi:hypothetical protein